MVFTTIEPKPIPRSVQLMSAMRHSRVEVILGQEDHFREHMKDRSITINNPDGTKKVVAKLVHHVVAQFAHMGMDAHKMHKTVILKAAFTLVGTSEWPVIQSSEAEFKLPKPIAPTPNEVTDMNNTSPTEWLTARRQCLDADVQRRRAELELLEAQLLECDTALAAISGKLKAPDLEHKEPQADKPEHTEPEPPEDQELAPLLFENKPTTRQRLIECATMIAEMAVSSRLATSTRISVRAIRSRVPVGVHLASFALEFMASVPKDVRLVDRITNHTFTASELATGLREGDPDYSAIVDRIKRVLAKEELPLFSSNNNRSQMRAAADKVVAAGFRS